MLFSLETTLWNAGNGKHVQPCLYLRQGKDERSVVFNERLEIVFDSGWRPYEGSPGSSTAEPIYDALLEKKLLSQIKI
jgi:hypothetical protein